MRAINKRTIPAEKPTGEHGYCSQCDGELICVDCDVDRLNRYKAQAAQLAEALRRCSVYLSETDDVADCEIKAIADKALANWESTK